jgi:2-methylfumaryl-CoA isomerase
MIGPMLDVDMDDEGGRFLARDAIGAVIAPWCAARTLAEIRAALDGTGVLWGPYQDFRQLLEEDPRCSPANPMFAEMDQPGIGTLLLPRGPLGFGSGNSPPRPAPRLGQDTDAVLAGVLGLSTGAIGKLHDAGVVK